MEPKQVTEYIRAIGEGLKPLADQVSGGGKQLFDYAIRHNYAVAIENIVSFVVMSGVAFGMYRAYRWLCQPLPGKTDHYGAPEIRMEQPEFAAPVFIGMAITAILFAVSLVCALSSIHRIIAPEWSAIADVIELIKPK